MKIRKNILCHLILSYFIFLISFIFQKDGHNDDFTINPRRNDIIYDNKTSGDTHFTFTWQRRQYSLYIDTSIHTPHYIFCFENFIVIHDLQKMLRFHEEQLHRHHPKPYTTGWKMMKTYKHQKPWVDMSILMKKMLVSSYGNQSFETKMIFKDKISQK